MVANFFAVIATAATINTGVMHGHHLISDNVNNTHPYIQYEQNGYGASLFINSFERVSFGVYKKLETSPGKLTANLKIGLVTGYNEYNIYNGRVYQLDKAFLLSDGVMFSVIPEIKYKFDNDIYLNSMILGESISIGFGYQF